MKTERTDINQTNDTQSNKRENDAVCVLKAEKFNCVTKEGMRMRMRMGEREKKIRLTTITMI